MRAGVLVAAVLEVLETVAMAVVQAAVREPVAQYDAVGRHVVGE